MTTDKERDRAYIEILKEELIPAMGCTEPIAIALAGAKARSVLGRIPEQVLLEVSRNIIKNVKSVVVPNTGGLKGLEASVAAGVVAGQADRGLEVLEGINESVHAQIRSYLETTKIEVVESQSELIFDLTVSVAAGEDRAQVKIANYHTNIVRVTRNGEDVPVDPGCEEVARADLTDRSLLSVRGIVDFAERVDVAEVDALLQRQIDSNMAIAEAGLAQNWGANIGSVLLGAWGDDIKTRAKALAAAGSDARMGGCELPVVIVAGSGNQGITASVPVIAYARELKAPRDTLLRALLVSNLVALHLKTGIGRLSAYCGAVSAGCAAGAGICWLHGGRFEEIAHTIVNSLAIVSGMVCDGAKPSCAAKIAASVDAGILGFLMYQQGQEFYDGEGLVTKGVEKTIANISRLGREGMRETDREIIRIMLGS